MVQIFNGKSIRNAIRNGEEEKVGRDHGLLTLDEGACVGTSFFTETPAKQALSKTSRCLTGQMIVHVCERTEDLGWEEACYFYEFGTFSQPWVLTRCTPAALPPPVLQTAGVSETGFGVPSSVWAEVTSVCPWPTRCRIKGLSLDLPHLHQGLRVSLLAHWGLPWGWCLVHGGFIVV